MSKYLDSVITYYEDSYPQLNQEVVTHYISGLPALANYGFVTLTDKTYQEESYKGHWLITESRTYSIAPVLDSTGEQAQTRSEADSSINRGETQVIATHRAWAWRDGVQEEHPDTNTWWLSVFHGQYDDTNLQKVLKKAKARLDIEASLQAKREEIKEACSNKTHINIEEPFNLRVNDYAYVNAYGGWRKGVVVGTTGRRFIVGYVVPSNTIQIRYKTVNLSQTRIAVNA